MNIDTIDLDKTPRIELLQIAEDLGITWDRYPTTEEIRQIIWETYQARQ